MSFRQRPRHRGIPSMFPMMQVITGYSMIILVLLVESSSSSDWYKKYPAYPPYCSTPDEMKTRSIPPVADDDKLGATRLVHVTAVIRHGARTPVVACWVGAGVETTPWDCNLTTLVATPSPNEIAREESTSRTNPDALPLSILEKRYDALMDPEDGLSNTLNGTCQYGQLLLQGYEQEETNGIYLRKAYVYDDDAYDHDERMRLIDVSSSKKNKNYNPFAEPTVRFRSDDDQRTVMSGQIVLQGMFGPEMIKSTKLYKRPPTIPVHLADRNRDIVDPNNDLCPRLAELQEEVNNSPEYHAWTQSTEAQRLNNYMKQHLGSAMGYEAIDCLMTTICTDRPLPDALDDYGRLPNRTRLLQQNETHVKGNATITTERNVFQRIIDYNVGMYALYIRHNDSEPSKLGMAPLWAEIMENINPIVDPETKRQEGSHAPAKFALFSGHDDTIMPLLASLGPRVWDGSEWPPYASMVLIEIHEIIDGKTDRTVFKSNFAFRLIYNGKILTRLMDGCPSDSDLCDVQVLRDRVKPFATRSMGCSRRKDPTILGNVQHTVQSLSEIKGLWLLSLAIAAFSSMVSSVLTCICLRLRPIRTFRQSEVDEEGRVALTLTKGHQKLYSDEPETLYGHDAYQGNASRLEAAAIDATLA